MILILPSAFILITFIITKANTAPATPKKQRNNIEARSVNKGTQIEYVADEEVDHAEHHEAALELRRDLLDAEQHVAAKAEHQRKADYAKIICIMRACAVAYDGD